ncbi:hypothetical protein THASP1DRAFT_25455 [Thamnocephalis sphaerospora]|uniref:Uncharacterized protein n=1 Tax=Thamnocephalis sphaerospora TaxID=78915 RepID=A0A4P9XK77_9FUNG|nr:hypothetical protein THASP1DRAFT_25455 [Thamnocephalis sphaerospora]|eukprot:RKP06165.1 hypothetical protein THASP1DRAFT_25455 [Thamnocephalis sphaerospora]
MRTLVFLAAFLVGLMTVAHQAAAIKETIKVPADGIDGVCATEEYNFVTYLGDATSGSLVGFYVTDKSSFDKAVADTKRNSTFPSFISFRYAISASCSGTKTNRTKHCDIGPSQPVSIAAIVGTPCILLDNINATVPAVVDLEYKFSNTSKFTSSANSASLNADHNFGLMSVAFAAVLALLSTLL